MWLLWLSEDASKKHPFPCPTTYRTALLHYLSVTHTPGMNIVRELAEYAQDQEEKEFLIKCSSSSPEGKVRRFWSFKVFLRAFSGITWTCKSVYLSWTTTFACFGLCVKSYPRPDILVVCRSCTMTGSWRVTERCCTFLKTSRPCCPLSTTFARCCLVCSPDTIPSPHHRRTTPTSSPSQLCSLTGKQRLVDIRRELPLTTSETTNLLEITYPRYR